MDNVQKIEDSLWEAAEKLRVDSGLKSTQYSTPLLGLVFLRFASIKYDRFKEEIEAEYNRFKGGRNEKRIEDIALQKCGYYLPPQSHFDYLLSLSESEDIPLAIKKAMEGIEEFKPELVGSLPKEEYLNLLQKTMKRQLYATIRFLHRCLKSSIESPKMCQVMFLERCMNIFWVSLLVTKAKAVVNTTRLPVLYALW